MSGEKPEGLAGVARTEAFSDGVFAIAITLLILSIQVPTPAGPGMLWAALALQWPAYVAYVLSFGVIGIMWANHHNIFRYIGRANHVFVMLNMALLFWVEVGFYFLVRSLRTGSWRAVLLAGAAQGLAFLCKSYVASIIFGVSLPVFVFCWLTAAAAGGRPGPRGRRHPGVPVRTGVLPRGHAGRAGQRVGEPGHSRRPRGAVCAADQVPAVRGPE